MRRAGAAAAVAALLAACIASVPAGAGDGAWRTLHGNANRDAIPFAGSPWLRPAWRALDVAVASGVALDSAGQAYVATMDEGPCHLHALDRAGNTRWCADAVRPAFSSPATGSDDSVFVTDGVEVFRFRADGALMWRVPASGPARGIVFARGAHPLVVDERGVVSMYHAANGAVLARLALEGGGRARPAPYPLAARALAAGLPAIGVADSMAGPVVDALFDYGVAVGNNVPAVHPDRGRLFVPVTHAGGSTLYALDMAVGESGREGSLRVACSQPLGQGSAASPAISRDGKRVYATEAPGVLLAVSADDCARLWSLALPGEAAASPTVTPDGRVVVLAGGQVVGLDDLGDRAMVRWVANGAGLAADAGFAAARFSSVIAASADRLYAGASLLDESALARLLAPAHVVAVLDPATGRVLHHAPVPEEASTLVALAGDGWVYVPSRPLAKAVALGLPGLASEVAAPRPGLYALEPASRVAFLGNGVDVARGLLAGALGPTGRGDGENAAKSVRLARAQVALLLPVLGHARDIDEIGTRETQRVEAGLHAALSHLARYLAAPVSGDAPVPPEPLEDADRALSAVQQVLAEVAAA